MNQTPLTTARLAGENIKRKPFRTACLVLLVALFAFTLFGGKVMMRSLENGMAGLSQRMGADILAVPYGYEGDLQNALLRGEPSTFYLDAGAADKVASVEGVAAVSPQLYIATLSNSCCSYPVQLIGFDPETDFTILPWLSKELEKPLGDGEIVIGGSLTGEVGQRLKFFDQNYTIVGRLKKTGAGSDTSVFMNLATAKQAAQNSERLQAHPVAQGENLISSVMVKTQADANAKDVANAILQAYAKDGIYVVVTQNMMSDIAGSLGALSVYVNILAGALWVIAVGGLLIMFSATFGSRKRELSIYRVIGAPKGMLVRMILWESSLVSLIGAATGLALAALVVFPFSTYINAQLGLPYLQPTIVQILGMAAACFLVSFAMGPLASVYTAVRIGKDEIYSAVREDL